MHLKIYWVSLMVELLHKLTDLSRQRDKSHDFRDFKQGISRQ
ncbi:Uncharacterised protein [Yersinia bercovieri]|nr:Uncharacterised protein [Yersinia bercovieri]